MSVGTKVLPQLHGGKNIRAGIEFSLELDALFARSAAADLRQTIEELGLSDKLQIEKH